MCWCNKGTTRFFDIGSTNYRYYVNSGFYYAEVARSNTFKSCSNERDYCLLKINTTTGDIVKAIGTTRLLLTDARGSPNASFVHSVWTTTSEKIFMIGTIDLNTVEPVATPSLLSFRDALQDVSDISSDGIWAAESFNPYSGEFALVATAYNGKTIFYKTQQFAKAMGLLLNCGEMFSVRELVWSG